MILHLAHAIAHSVTGSLKDIETGEGLPARVHLYNGIVTLENWNRIRSYAETFTELTYQSVLYTGNPVLSSCQGESNQLFQGNCTAHSYVLTAVLEEVIRIVDSTFTFTNLPGKSEAVLQRILCHVDGIYSAVFAYDALLVSRSYQTISYWIPLLEDPNLSVNDFLPDHLYQTIVHSTRDFKVRGSS